MLLTINNIIFKGKALTDLAAQSFSYQVLQKVQQVTGHFTWGKRPRQSASSVDNGVGLKAQICCGIVPVSELS